ncbi:phage tail tape measure protein [Streptomyces asoensis]|uniref:phage tail tape measure protein n=1 Tax=Streptomyces asoensis TaxID=249586 RepID=UPI003716989B
MSLTVGELNAILSVDDQAMDPGLRRAEQALRQAGQRMGNDADRAGQQAGEGLGEGIVRGADGRLRNARGQFVRAGQQAGQQMGQGLVRGADGQWRNMRGELVDAVTAAAAEAEARAHRAGRRIGDEVGEGLTAGAGDGADEAVAETGTRLEKLKTVAGGIAAAAGAAAGALLVAGITEALDQSRIAGRLGAQLGATPEEARKYGKIAGQLYARAVTEDFQGAADAISVTMRSGLLPTGATDRQIQSMSTRVSDLASTFELDLGQAANAAGQMIKTGLAKNGTEALDVMTRGLQVMGPRADDLADTFNEYGTIFRNIGLDATTATGLMSQGMRAGARDTDVVADALKELTLITQGGGKAVDEAFAKIHLSGKEMQKAFAEGGPAARQGLDKIFDGLRAVKDPAERAQIAVALFGTKAEDTQKALLALDPSTAVDALGEVGGAADRMGNTLRDNAGVRLEAFKRGMKQRLVDFLGNTVIPAVMNSRIRIGKEFGKVWEDAGKGGTEGVDRVVKFFELVGQRLADKAVAMAPKVVDGLTRMGQRAADYVAANPETVFKVTLIAAALVAAIVKLPFLVAGALGAAAIAMISAFVGQLIIKTQENLPKWWASFTAWVSAKAGQANTYMDGLGASIGNWFGGLWSRYISGPVSRQWNSFLGSVRGLPGRTVAALNPMGGKVGSSASGAWQRFKDAAVAKGNSFLGWVHGLPGRVVSGMGSMSGLLISKGRNLVEGFWSGVSGMTGWIKSKLYGWARSAIPGPIAKALGIASPSRVTKAQGRWIARGLVEGLTGSTKQIKAASGKLSDIIADSLAPGRRRSKALGTLSAGTKQLLKYASTEERVAARLKVAQAGYLNLVKARNALAADVKKGILDKANITQQTGSEGNSAESILDQLRADTRAAQTFAANLAALRKKGVRSDLIAQIAQAGVDQGSSAAAALARASTSQVKAINSQQAALVSAAGKAGSTAGEAMYGAGIQAAAGLVRGLQSQQKAIEAQMTRIARAMAKSIRAALGIKSPSRVMALVGRYTGQGLVKGLDSQQAAVTASMASLVNTPAPGEWAGAGAGARGAGARAQGAKVYTLRSDGSAHMDYVVGELRKRIDHLGGDVQFVLGSGRG